VPRDVVRRIPAPLADRRPHPRRRGASLDKRDEERIRWIRRACRDHLRAYQARLRAPSRRARARRISASAQRLSDLYHSLTDHLLTSPATGAIRIVRSLVSSSRCTHFVLSGAIKWAWGG